MTVNITLGLPQMIILRDALFELKDAEKHHLGLDSDSQHRLTRIGATADLLNKLKRLIAEDLG